MVGGELKQWCESLGSRIMESTICHPKVNGLAVRSITTKKRVIQAWTPNLSFDGTSEHPQDAAQNSFGTIAGTECKTPAVADFDLYEPLLFKSTRSSVPATFIIGKRKNTSIIQSEISNKTVLVGDNQIARREPFNIKNESADQQSE